MIRIINQNLDSWFELLCFQISPEGKKWNGGCRSLFQQNLKNYTQRCKKKIHDFFLSQPYFKNYNHKFMVSQKDFDHQSQPLGSQKKSDSNHNFESKIVFKPPGFEPCPFLLRVKHCKYSGLEIISICNHWWKIRILQNTRIIRSIYSWSMLEHLLETSAIHFSCIQLYRCCKASLLRIQIHIRTIRNVNLHWNQIFINFMTKEKHT